SLDTYELSEADIPIVADICRRLDGLPLAIELAAARVDLFGVRGLAARLDDRVALLTRGPRTAVAEARAMRATLHVGYGILSALEQRSLCKLAVFAGAFDVAAATALIVDDEVREADVLDILANLAAKSLLVASVVDEQTLYRLFDSSRAYALEK